MTGREKLVEGGKKRQRMKRKEGGGDNDLLKAETAISKQVSEWSLNSRQSASKEGRSLGRAWLPACLRPCRLGTSVDDATFNDREGAVHTGSSSLEEEKDWKSDCIVWMPSEHSSRL